MTNRANGKKEGGRAAGGQSAVELVLSWIGGKRGCSSGGIELIACLFCCFLYHFYVRLQFILPFYSTVLSQPEANPLSARRLTHALNPPRLRD